MSGVGPLATSVAPWQLSISSSLALEYDVAQAVIERRPRIRGYPAEDKESPGAGGPAPPGRPRDSAPSPPGGGRGAEEGEGRPGPPGRPRRGEPRGPDAPSRAVPAARPYPTDQLRRPGAGGVTPGLPIRPGAGGDRQARRRGAARPARGAEGGSPLREPPWRLGRIGPDSAEAVLGLVHLLADRSLGVRRERRVPSAAVGPAAVVPLIAASSDGNPVVRVAAIEGLGSLPEADRRGRRRPPRGGSVPGPPSLGPRPSRRSRGSRCPTTTSARSPARGSARRRAGSAGGGQPPGGALRPLLLELVPECESLLTASDERSARHAADLLGRGGPGAARGALVRAAGGPGSRVESIRRRPRPPPAGPPSGCSSGRPPTQIPGSAAARPWRLGRIRPLSPETGRRLVAGLADPDTGARSGVPDLRGRGRTAGRGFGPGRPRLAA